MFNSSTIPKRIPRVARASPHAGSFLADRIGKKQNARPRLQLNFNWLFAYDRQSVRTATRTDAQRIAYGDKMPSGPFARALARRRADDYHPLACCIQKGDENKAHFYDVLFVQAGVESCAHR